ncbi:MAG: cyclic nucleotide-binding domain-containing protein [Gammaproteobacteria bacterium]|nr:MAG: cyclic nucleotide-binding domain-containing protein [Gammaproteobacteria bacterium]
MKSNPSPADPAGTKTPHIAVLSGAPLFGGVEGRVLARLLGYCHFIHREPGEYFYREGEKGESMYLLEKGLAIILKRWGEKDLELRRLEAGDCFGEVALVDFGPRSVSVRAVEPCDAVEVPVAALHRLYEIDPEQYTLVQMNIARELSRQLREADERLLRYVAGCKPGNDPEGPCVG